MSIADAPLDAAERQAIAEMATHVPAPRAAAIDALKFLQARRRYISDGVLADLAAALDMSTAALDEIATFYNLIFRKPVGEHVILLCDSITCWVLGRDKLQAHIRTTLGISPGETTADGKVTLLPVVCLGACDRAPVLLAGEILHGDVTTTKLDALLRNFRERVA